jgi:hypothetical protein
MGLVMIDQGKYDDANNILLKGLQIYEITCGKSHIDCSITLSNLGTVFLKKKSYITAMAYFRKSL